MLSSNISSNPDPNSYIILQVDAFGPSEIAGV